MQQFERVSINPSARKLSDIMDTKSKDIGKTKTTVKPKMPKKSKKNMTKEQITNIMNMNQSQTPAQQAKYSSKDNKLNIKEDKVMRVLNYQNSSRFGPSVRKELKFNYTRDQLMKKSLDQIDNVLYRIRNFLNNRGMNGIYEQMVRTSAIGYENIVSEIYDIEGFSDMLMQNPAFWDAFERWKIERTLPDIPPSLQLMYIVGSTTLIAHMKKTSLEHDSEIKKQMMKNKKNNEKNKDEDKLKTKLSAGVKLS